MSPLFQTLPKTHSSRCACVFRNLVWGGGSIYQAIYNENTIYVAIFFLLLSVNCCYFILYFCCWNKKKTFFFLLLESIFPLCFHLLVSGTLHESRDICLIWDANQWIYERQVTMNTHHWKRLPLRGDSVRPLLQIRRENRWLANINVGLNLER